VTFILWLWRNFVKCWQPRWFVLENGVISYYDSEDDVSKGSKGSIKMSVCDIKGQTAGLKCVADDLTCPPSCCFNNNKHCSCFFLFQFIRQI
uniref:Uncharacterized protein n=1 Tax=Sparus aurata TaxID=8175 RepID=A0A671VLL8_SPAAU